MGFMNFSGAFFQEKHVHFKVDSTFMGRFLQLILDLSNFFIQVQNKLQESSPMLKKQDFDKFDFLKFGVQNSALFVKNLRLENLKKIELVHF